MEFKYIKYEIADSILTVTLNRSDKLNAINREVTAELINAFDNADADDGVRVVIVTGAGRAFCAGADLSLGKDTWDYKARGFDIETYRDHGGLVTLRLYDMKKPLIAAINGTATGFGASFILPMDIRLAAETAKFGYVFTRRGIVMEACSSWFLPRIVGISKAAEWVMTGRIFDAREALTSGLLHEVLPPDALMPRARQIAAEIAQNTSATSIALCRQLLWKSSAADHPMEAHRLDSRLMFWAGGQADAREGISSFLEKRPPKFTMKPSSDMPDFYPWWKQRPFKL